MHFHSERAAILGVSALLLSACGSGGNDRTPPGNPTPPPNAGPPTIAISANPTTVAPGQGTTITWSTTNAASCSASGGWSGARGTSGTEQIPAITSTATFTLGCVGSSGGAISQSVTVQVTGPGGGNVVVSGGRPNARSWYTSTSWPPVPNSNTGPNCASMLLPRIN